MTALLFATLFVKRIELKLRSDCQFCAFHVAKYTAIILVGSARNLKLLQEIIVNESSFYFSVVTFIRCLLILYIVLYLSINFNIKKKINESLTHYYKHHEDYIMSFLKT